MKSYWKIFAKMAFSALALLIAPIGAHSGELLDRIAAGQPIRIGFANEIPWAYPGPNNEAAGFVNANTIGVLKEMGYTNIEPIVTDWGGLIPGLQANQFDIVTGGMAILKTRCDSVLFSEPMATAGDAFIVKKGNPKKIQTFTDIARENAIMVTAAGYSSIEYAKKEGVPADKIMQVPSVTEILAAVVSGRADAGAVTLLTAQEMEKKSQGQIEVTDSAALPEFTKQWVGVAFRKSDSDFLEKYNAAQKKFLGTPKMMSLVEPYGYNEQLLPGDKTTEWVCANR